ncbi:unnamed protein product, partial [Brenthis ino]
MSCRLEPGLSSLALLIFTILLMSSNVNCQINGTIELSSIILGHLQHTLDSLTGFARIAEMLGTAGVSEMTG